jgi:hypothetical protein
MKLNKETRTIGIYLFVFVYIILVADAFFVTGLLDSSHLLYWDAGNYYSIRNHGYEDLRFAFFPLFPLMWRISHIGIHGILLLNMLLFVIPFYYLIRMLRSTVTEILIYLTIPGFIFFYLPYTESLFFATSVIMLAGVRQRNTLLVIIGLFLSTLTRPSFTIVFPALLIAELMTGKADRKMALRVALYLGAILLGILVVGLIQHYYTGRWFEFFTAQKRWGNELRFPKLPLTSWAGGLIVRLDGVALLLGLAAGLALTLRLLKIPPVKNIKMPGEVALSLAYLGGITLSVLAFRGGSLFSLNRFILASPFIIVALDFWFRQQVRLRTRHLVMGFFLIYAFWLLFGSYTHILSMLRFFLVSLYLVPLLAIRSGNEKVAKGSAILLIALNLVFQVLLMVRFLSGNWVG